MNKGPRNALIIALILIIAGLIIFGITYGKAGKQMFEGFDRSKYTKEYRPGSGFGSVFIDCTSCGLTIERSESGECLVETVETEKLYFTVGVENGTLRIVQHDDSKWFDRLFNFGSLGIKATVYLPEKQYESLELRSVSGGVSIADLDCGGVKLVSTSGSVKLAGLDCTTLAIDSTSGSVKLEGVGCGELDIDSTSGSLTLADVNAGSVRLKSSSGSVRLDRVIAEGRLDADCTSGGIKLDSVDAAELYLRTVSGSVRGSLLSGKRFSAKATSGSVHVPADTDGGLCVIETTSGSIDITVKG